MTEQGYYTLRRIYEECIKERKKRYYARKLKELECDMFY